MSAEPAIEVSPLWPADLDHLRIDALEVPSWDDIRG